MNKKEKKKKEKKKKIYILCRNYASVKPANLVIVKQKQHSITALKLTPSHQPTTTLHSPAFYATPFRITAPSAPPGLTSAPDFSPHPSQMSSTTTPSYYGILTATSPLLGCGLDPPHPRKPPSSSALESQ